MPVGSSAAASANAPPAAIKPRTAPANVNVVPADCVIFCPTAGEFGAKPLSMDQCDKLLEKVLPAGNVRTVCTAECKKRPLWSKSCVNCNSHCPAKNAYAQVAAAKGTGAGGKILDCNKFLQTRVPATFFDTCSDFCRQQASWKQYC